MEFGTTRDGDPVEMHAITSEAGMTVRLMDLGATLVGWDVPDRHGAVADVVLGFDNLADYESKKNQHFGSTTGRYANRIANGRFALDGVEYQLATNNGTHHLHGGRQRGLDKAV
ncbi:MAG: galactose-1-epimerase, partial [Aeoliella sp.]